VSGIGEGDELEVRWPRDDGVSLMAILQPEAMTKVILEEIERAASDPMPLAQRTRRMDELRERIDELSRTAFALNGDARALPPEVVLGVKVARREAVRKVERRMSAARA
jgi:hypothetical protein